MTATPPCLSHHRVRRELISSLLNGARLSSRDVLEHSHKTPTKDLDWFFLKLFNGFCQSMLFCSFHFSQQPVLYFFVDSFARCQGERRIYECKKLHLEDRESISSLKCTKEQRCAFCALCITGNEGGVGSNRGREEERKGELAHPPYTQTSSPGDWGPLPVRNDPTGLTSPERSPECRDNYCSLHCWATSHTSLTYNIKY